MSNHRSLRFLLVLLFAAFSSAALVLVDAGALGQNANSSTTEESVQNDNANMTPQPRRGRRGRRGTRRKVAAEPATDIAVIAPVAQDDDSRGDLSGERADLSGTYSGRLTMTGGHEMSGAATLTITGNTFQLESEGMNHGGRVYAVTTRGYTGAAFYFTDLTDSVSNTALVANVRARKKGDWLWLSPAPGSRNKMTFASGGGGGGGRRGRR